MVFTIILLFVVPLLLGLNYLKFAALLRKGNLKIQSVFTKKIDIIEYPAAVFIAWVMGFISLLALYQIIYLPFILTSQEFLPVHNIFVVTIGVLSIISILLNLRDFYKLILNLMDYIKSTPLVYILAIGLIIYQLYYVLTTQFIDEDDAFFLPIAGEALLTNKMFATDPSTGIPATDLNARYAFSPYLIFIATLSKITGIHHTILAHTVLSVFFVAVAYVVYDILGNELFENDRKKTGWFLTFISLINILGQFSTLSPQALLLHRAWQGRVVALSVILPLLFWLVVRIAKQKQNAVDWIMLFVVNLAATTLTSTSVYLTALFLGAFTLSIWISQKRANILIPMLICVIPNFTIFFIYAIN